MASSIDSSSPALSTPVLIRCQGILFDMDGILISSLGSVERSWTKWANLRGIDPAYACRMAHGCRSIDTVAKLRPDLDAETENKMIEDMEVEDTEGIILLPGVLKLLTSLPSNRWTVATSATDRLARVRMQAAGIPVPERFINGNSVTEGKPHPAPFLAGAALLGFRPEECVVFEDSSSGAQSGRAAGCTVVATTFSHSIESLAAAHYLIADATKVEAVTLPADEGIALRITPLAV